MERRSTSRADFDVRGMRIGVVSRPGMVSTAVSCILNWNKHGTGSASTGWCRARSVATISPKATWASSIASNSESLVRVTNSRKEQPTGRSTRTANVFITGPIASLTPSRSRSSKGTPITTLARPV